MRRMSLCGFVVAFLFAVNANAQTVYGVDTTTGGYDVYEYANIVDLSNNVGGILVGGAVPATLDGLAFDGVNWLAVDNSGPNEYEILSFPAIVDLANNTDSTSIGVATTINNFGIAYDGVRWYSLEELPSAFRVFGYLSVDDLANHSSPLNSKQLGQTSGLDLDGMAYDGTFWYGLRPTAGGYDIYQYPTIYDLANTTNGAFVGGTVGFDLDGLSFAAPPTSIGDGLSEADLESTGDGWITRDADTGLEWLDLHLVQGISMNDVMAGLCGLGSPATCPPGGWVASGWRYATTNEVCDLMTKLGFGPAICPGTTPHTQPNELISLHEQFLTRTFAGPGSAGFLAVFDDGGGDPNLVGDLYILDDFSHNGTTVRVSGDGGPQNTTSATSSPSVGHLLVREIAIPSVPAFGWRGEFALVFLLCGIACGWLKRSNSMSPIE